MSYLDADPSKTKRELLTDILDAAQQRHMPGLPLLPFGALLVKVGDEASETIADLKAHITTLNQKNARLQGLVIALAVAALVSTLVQTVIAVWPHVNTPSGVQPSTPPVSATSRTPSATAVPPSVSSTKSTVPPKSFTKAPASVDASAKK